LSLEPKGKCGDEVDVDDDAWHIICSPNNWNFFISGRILISTQIKSSAKMTVPSADVSVLHRADGSARYSAAGYTVVAAVNGPIEVTRRDELPQHAALEVNVRPSIGVGSEYQYL